MYDGTKSLQLPYILQLPRLEEASLHVILPGRIPSALAVWTEVGTRAKFVELWLQDLHGKHKAQFQWHLVTEIFDYVDEGQRSNTYIFVTTKIQLGEKNTVILLGYNKNLDFYELRSKE